MIIYYIVDISIDVSGSVMLNVSFNQILKYFIGMLQANIELCVQFVIIQACSHNGLSYQAFHLAEIQYYLIQIHGKRCPASRSWQFGDTVEFY